MKVVADTNVVISGVFFKGPPYRVLQAWRNGSIDIVVTPQILEEYARVGALLAKQFEGIAFDPFLALLVAQSSIVDPIEPSPAIVTDPDDDKFFACALAGGAVVIVSGDRHLFKTSGYRGVDVLTPRQFLDKFL